MQFFEHTALTPTPWKNGGGVTREIVCWPPGAGMEDFDWRASIALVAADGPFSAFPGIDRVITLLEGDGMRLSARDGSFNHALDVPLVPFAFAGEAAVDSVLLGGESQDFNVMTRRGKFSAQVRVLTGAGTLEAGRYGLLLANAGTWSLARRDPAGKFAPLAALPAGSGCWWADELHEWQCLPDDGNASLLAVRLVSAAP